ncbi:DUF1127 domain-containing protein [Tritonibacter scottomollicae]|uniref:DUF1127 domain-containing protein n=1 Tax=Tritonibacter scottomollicae TaxID=483013 RepID=A0ABZ0HIX8_TRISK|nr:DUF1127 domain-containing protein [Tritonibacter scottomollicae]WOI34099.1 DUF1127 domain-containing protein [Tritonibacter scottomollicae]
MTNVTEHPTHLSYLTNRAALPMIAEVAIGFAVLATKWSVRRRSRRQLSRLTQQQLRDIGLQREDAMREGTLPFWRP